MKVFDIETDNLLYEVTTLHCIVLKDTESQTIFIGEDQGIRADSSRLPPGYNYSYISTAEALDLLKKDTIIGHNICGYDMPALKKLYDFKHETSEQRDTMLMSQMFRPDVPGGHSLAAWTKRLGNAPEKVANEDWSKLTPKILERCIKDVLITEEIWNELLPEWEAYKPWGPALLLEQHVARIHAQQVMHGVRFDVMKAVELLNHLDTRSEELARDITKLAPMRCVRKNQTVTVPLKKNGLPKKAVTDWFGVERTSLGTPLVQTIAKDHENVLVPFTVQIGTKTESFRYGAFNRISFEEINLNSGAQVKALLLNLGWKPTEYNLTKLPNGKFIKTSPKLTEDSYASLPAGVGQKIAEYNVIKHRRSFLLNKKNNGRGALANVRKDGRIEADAMTCGTPTGRYTHMGVACNIPSPNHDKDGNLVWFPDPQPVPYGTEMRALFCVSKGSTMLGCDLCGIEARFLAHYCMGYKGGPEMAEEIMDGDFHQKNADAWDCDRNLHAKHGLYALLYGCGNALLAVRLGKPLSQGKKLKDAFWKANPAIPLLMEDLEASYNRYGFIRGLDGRRIYCRDSRRLLNAILQSAGAILFKLWMVKADEYLKTLIGTNKECHQIISYHDEIQLELMSTDPDIIKNVGEKITSLAVEAGEQLGVLVPTESAFLPGQNWAMCH